MSRTDNHRPHAVQLADPYEKRWHRVEDGHTVTWWPLYRFGCRPHCVCSSVWSEMERRRQRRDGRRLTRRAMQGDWEACD